MYFVVNACPPKTLDVATSNFRGAYVTLCRGYWATFFVTLTPIVRQNSGQIYEDLELDFKLFSLLILVEYILSLKNPSDATLASLSVSIYPRWRPRWRPIISENIVGDRKLSQPHLFPLKLLVMKLKSS